MSRRRRYTLMFKRNSFVFTGEWEKLPEVLGEQRVARVDSLWSAPAGFVKDPYNAPITPMARVGQSRQQVKRYVFQAPL
eukprot:5141809-Pyramimonas_sp.AAC.1